MSGDSGETYSDTETQYGAPVSYLDVSNIPRHEVLNFEGTPTQFYDDTGLRGILTRDGKIKDVSSFNPIVKAGEKITADTPIQQVDDEGVLLYSDGEGVTRRNTGIPAIGGTLGDQSYMREIKNKGVFGTIGGDLLGVAKDPAFHKFLMAAAAIGTGGLALNAAYGVGGLGAAGGLGAGAGLGPVATAYPVTGGGLIAGTELAPLAAGGVGAGGMGAAGAGGVGGGLGGLGGAGGAGGTGIAGTGITGAQALQAAKMVMPVLSAISGGGAGAPSAGGSPFAIPTAAASGAGASGLSQMASLNPQFLTTGSAPTTTPSGLIDYKPLSYIEPAHYASVSDIKPLSMFDKSPFESGLQAAHGGHIKESMDRHPELQDVDPRLLSMIMQSMAFQDGGKSHVPEFITGATGHYVKGKGDGQSDEIPAMLADGEFVWDADTVAQLGNGSSDAGAKFLDKFREAVRSHKRSAPNDKIPPKASPLQYVKEAMKNTEKE